MKLSDFSGAGYRYKLYFITVLLMLAFAPRLVKAQCSSCTFTVNANSSASYSLNAGQNLCIMGGTFTGNINSFSSTSRICISGTAVFNGNISNFPAGAQIYIDSNATFTPQSFNNLSGEIKNYGKVNFNNSFSFNTGFKIDNYGAISITQSPNFNGAVTILNKASGVINYTPTFQFGNGSSMTNDGTVICLSDFQNNGNAAITNNGYFFLQNGSSNNFNPNAPFTNYGVVYAEGFININSSSTVINYCTLYSNRGFNNNSNNTRNYGNIQVKIISNPSSQDELSVKINNNFYNAPSGWVQGTSFFNQATISGGGNYYFSYFTLNQGNFGNDGDGDSINFYDATACFPNATNCNASSKFDVNNSAPHASTTKNAISPKPDDDFPATCATSIQSLGTNSECGGDYYSVPTSIITNGSFTTNITNSTGNTYVSGAGTTYNFTGGSFISQTDYRGTGASACADRTNGNAFAIVTTGTGVYTGAGNCAGTSQVVFPGDAAYGVGTQGNFMFVAGNTSAGNEYLVWQQNISGLIIGQSYTFYFYASNMRETANAAANDPTIRIRIDGTDGLPNGTVAYGPFVLTESATLNNSPNGGWKRFAYNFTATATTVKLKITDGALGSSGDQWALTAIGLTKCVTANPGGDAVAKDGSHTLSPGSTETYIFNRYAVLDASVSSGANSIAVTNIADLSASTTFPSSYDPYTTDVLSAGDLVMILQMQGANITTSDNFDYGIITDYNNTGKYELRVVTSVSGNTINFCEPLVNSYAQSGRNRSQVVRVPRLNNLTLSNANAIVASKPWNGSTGGVCVLEINGDAVINGSISASGTGFRGGVDPASSTTAANVTTYRTTATGTSSGKGESIAGNTADYASLNGAYGRGAPANGGGGGNGTNTGGGGGANAGNNGSLTPWNGTGIKSVSTPNWANAWNLEAANFATDTSRGGGRGGYSRSTSNRNALTEGPGDPDWNGDDRRNHGGFGGRPLDYASNTRLFLGGGGGGGEEDDGEGGEGGAGGGIIYLLVKGNINGTGGIISNGAAGGSTTGNNRDGAGGGGGGGAIVVLCNSTITGVTITANGGDGGDVLIPSSNSFGPGGGGGGGYILTTPTNVTRTANGGTHGTSASNSLTEFLPNGATQGSPGTINTSGTYAEPNGCFAERSGLGDVSCTPGTGSIVASNTIVNTYYPAIASAAAGAIKIRVGTKRTEGNQSNIIPGDLLLVIQMQGSIINSTNTSSYGDGTAGGASGYTSSVAGTYEFVYAASAVINGVVYLTTPLKNSYTHADYNGTAGQYRFQVVRVPQYSTLNIANGSSITTAEWNGSSGGIIAADVAGTMTLNGGVAINASDLGFRGGGGRQLAGGTGVKTDLVTLSSNNANGSKGEGIAGTPKYTRSIAGALIDNGLEGYPNGSYAAGAPGNAGGGSTDGNPAANDENTGGGGGGNGGAGGQGGTGWSDNTAIGGFGGSAIDFVAPNRLVLGGGGGAGTTNNGTAQGQGNNISYQNGFYSSGGSGGGMIFLKIGAVSGTGTIQSNGADGLAVDNDGGGGGGAGGSVYLYAANTAGFANITINAVGGKGGNAWILQPNNGINNDGNPEHGPGGGGGGGVIYTNGTINAASSVAGGIPGLTTTSNLPYNATAGATGIKLTSAVNPVKTIKIFCDIDDDDDGIADVAENYSNSDPFGDTDNDGIPNSYDDIPFVGENILDENADGINDLYDNDLDGIISQLDKDSDNDGVPDVVEAYGVDINGDGLIDSFVDANADGLSDNAAVTSATNGLGIPDFDGDGIANYFDLDSDNDGIPDIIEAGATDSNNDGRVDSSADADDDGYNDATEASPVLLSGTDTDGDGKANSWPNKNVDQLGYPNLYDLDSDGDGITDMTEAGFAGANGIANGTRGTDGWSNTIDALASLNLPNTDARGPVNFLDIDSDDDGITDNVEGQPTFSYKLPSVTDDDGDGLNDEFEASPGSYGGGGITPYDHDADNTPDYRDADSDNDGRLDANEGAKISGNFIDVLTDADGDGLLDEFDTFNVNSPGPNPLSNNVGHNEMGALGNFDGPVPSGSNSKLHRTNTSGDRDWRNSTVLPISIISFSLSYREPDARLVWEVENEFSTSNYTVERSANGTNFITIHTVSAKNNGRNIYSYTDVLTNFSPNTLYYRIKQTDKNGTSYYTNTAVLKLSSKNKLEVSPNPFAGYVNLFITSEKSQKAFVRITDAKGRIVKTDAIAVQRGNNSIQITDLENLSRGNYIIQVMSGIEILVQKLIKL